MEKVDVESLEAQVKEVYTEVAEDPHREFHFETGRGLAERLGYRPEDLDRIPPEAVDSFAGVGCPLQLASLRPGERVLDLGSGSGMDAYVAALHVGPEGRVVGLDMTEAQRTKAERLRDRAGFSHVEFASGYIERLPFDDASFDCIISNGVINLSPDKPKVFREAARVLVPGGRFAISDIVSDHQLPEGIKCDAGLWAACIGGAVQRDLYRESIEAAGMSVSELVTNEAYSFISENARKATQKFGVKSISLLAVKQ